MTEIRTRFAPSPTGYLHIGGARTALFSYLYARSQGGEFVLRIEDTDQERSEPRFEKEILDGLSWLGLDWDGEPFRQSSDFEFYRKTAQGLVDAGKAYVSHEKGAEAILLKVEPQPVVFFDLLRGKIEHDARLFGDIVLIKSDGAPAFNFACALDDARMGITHVIRGDDHIANTPRQLLVLQALSMVAPKYAHIPLIFGDDGTPLSKRHGAVSLTAYQTMGFLPAGMMNYLSLLGWGPGGDREYFEPEELCREFRLKRVNLTASTFDPVKLRWVNGQHIRKMSIAKVELELIHYLQGLGKMPEVSETHFSQIVELFAPRIRTWDEFLSYSSYCFSDPETFADEAIEKHLLSENIDAIMDALMLAVAKIDFSKIEALESSVRETANSLGLEAKHLIHPIRVALTGSTMSPGLFELMSVLGSETVLRRLDFLKKSLPQLREQVSPK